MYLNLGIVADHLAWVLLLLIGPVLAKLVLIVILARAFRSPLATALRTGFYLAQAGEFAIVLLALSTDLHILDATFPQLVLAAMVLSMLAAPFMIQLAEPLVAPDDRQRLARPRRAGHADRGAHDLPAGSRDRLRLRPQRPESRRACSKPRAYRFLRWTRIRSASPRRPPAARQRRLCAMPAGAKR